MDVQIAKLHEGLKQAAKAEETIGRIEKLSEDTVQRMESAGKLNADVQRDVAKIQKESTALLEAVRAEVGSLGMRKREFEAFDERVQSLQTSVNDSEVRMKAIAAKETNLLALGQKVDGLNKRVESLFVQSDDLTKKQGELESLHERRIRLRDFIGCE